MKVVERHLYIRNGYYYFRKALSRNLHSLLPFREIWVGLNTQDITTARLQSVQLNYEITKELNLFRQKLMDLPPAQLPDQIVHDFLSRTEEIKSAFGYQPPVCFGSKWNGKSNKTTKLLFSQVVEKYLDDCPSDTHGTRFHKENTYKLFVELVGDPAFQDISIHEARQFKTLLMKIPSNAKKIYNLDSFKGVDLDKLNGKPQHPKTINNRLAYLIALFNWAIRTDYYHGKNPFSTLPIRNKKIAAARRHPFKPEELQALFKNGLGKGVVKYPSMYWAPLIGLYSGMRLNEICQLYVTDIRKEDGIYIFDVNDDGEDKGLKTASSRRKIPIHQHLIEQGFLKYIADIKATGGTRAFPDIPMGKCAKNYSSTFTKRFWRLLKELEIKRDGLCFHSLRHTFIDGMRNAGVERSIVMNLTGHQSSKEVHDAYGYGYNLSILQDNINKLAFPL